MKPERQPEVKTWKVLKVKVGNLSFTARPMGSHGRWLSLRGVLSADPEEESSSATCRMDWWAKRT